MKFKSIYPIAILTLAAFGCSNASSEHDQEPVGPVDPGDEIKVTLNDVRTMASRSACTLDSDCETGAFCFQRQCVVQCNEKLSCDQGYVCQISRGRCLLTSYLTELSQVQQKIEAAGDTMPETEKAALLAEQELKANAASPIQTSALHHVNAKGKPIARIDVTKSVPQHILLGNQNIQTTSFRSKQYLGDIYYAVVTDRDTLPILKVAKPYVTLNSEYEYPFELDAPQLHASKRWSKRDGNDDTSVSLLTADIVSSAGSFATTLVDVTSAQNLYSGYVQPTAVLSGMPLPIRMVIQTVPAQPQRFEDIQSLTLYLPVSPSDLFSPENVQLQNGQPVETWVSVTATKSTEKTQNMSNKVSFVAEFSTNDFAPYQSALFDAQSKVNRYLRFEITDLVRDETTYAYNGYLRDGFTGLYRETSFDTETDLGTYQWNDTRIEGQFSVSFDANIDLPTERVHAHEKANTTQRPIDAEPVLVCDDAAIKQVMTAIALPATGCSAVDDTEKDACLTRQGCHEIIGLESLNALPDNVRAFCIDEAAQALLANDERFAPVLERILTANSTTTNTVTVCDQEISNFKDFQTLCEDSTCALCADHPEYACAADLLAMRYLDDTTLNDHEKAQRLAQWISLTQEANLPLQYKAWISDIDIRKSWLEGAVYENTFAASIMDDFNADLLKKYHENVLKLQYAVMKNQTRQLTLEMLAQKVKATELDLTSQRNTILNDLASVWQSVTTSISLAAKRYDVLLQNDVERLQAAKDLKAYMTDLYLSGVIETALNLKADQGSLNASFGAHLSDLVTKLSSLDQSFESALFMRDGEVFKDTRLETDTGLTALGTLQKAADDSIQKAENKRKSVFNEIDQKANQVLSIKDRYLTSLEKMRADIVDLCGYPTDCKDEATCKLFTEVYYCGFARDSLSQTPVSLTVENQTELDNTIRQVKSFSDCYTLKTRDQSAIQTQLDAVHACEPARLDTNDYAVAYTDQASVSQAGQAILDYRQAEKEYEIALAEYEMEQQKVANNFEMLEAYAQSIQNWYESRSNTLKQIQQNITSINGYLADLADYQLQVDELKYKEAAAEYDSQATMASEWKSMAKDSVIAEQINLSLMAGLNISTFINYASTMSDFYSGMTTLTSQAACFDPTHTYFLNALMGKTIDLDTLAEYANRVDLDNKEQTDILDELIRNYMDTAGERPIDVNLLLDRITGDQALELQGYASQVKSAATRMKSALVASEVIKYAMQTSNNWMTYEKSAIEMDMKTDAAKIQSELEKAIFDLRSNAVEGGLNEYKLKAAIRALEENNALLKLQIEAEADHQRDLRELEVMRNEHKNEALKLITLAYAVQNKNIQRYQAQTRYELIAQQASLLADQYDSKLARYKENNDLLFSASSFFQYASDLESVESTLESARNDLNDYLTAIEYLSVRPFVALRRSLYMARGTNDLAKIYEQLNQLTERCGAGQDTSNKVTVSLMSRLGILSGSINGLINAKRLQTSMLAGNLPVNSQIRYTADTKIGDKLVKGRYASASFTIDTSFANVANSCNAKIDDIQVRFVSLDGKPLRTDANYKPTISLIYGGQSQLLSCQPSIDAIVASIGSTSYGKLSTFSTTPFADGLVAAVYDVPQGQKYTLTEDASFEGASVYRGLKGYPLMATYTLVFDFDEGENQKLNWNNIADIEIQFKYTTGTLNSNTQCQYDL